MFPGEKHTRVCFGRRRADEDVDRNRQGVDDTLDEAVRRRHAADGEAGAEFDAAGAPCLRRKRLFEGRTTTFDDEIKFFVPVFGIAVVEAGDDHSSGSMRLISSAREVL